MEGDKMITNQMLTSFCEQALKKETYYMWGTYGKPITKSLIAAKAKQYPKKYSETRKAFLSKKANGKALGCDCAGLIKWALWTNANVNSPIKYDGKTDRGTNGLYDAATAKGNIATLPEERGVIVYKSGHVGVYVGNGYVVECTLGNRGDGVVKTRLAEAGWTHWLKIPEVVYTGEAAKPSNNKVSLWTKLKMLFNKL